MKKTLFFALVFALTTPMLKAQYYSTNSAIRGGRINVFGGIHSGLPSETKFFGNYTTTDSWGYVYRNSAEVAPTSLAYNTGACLGIDLTVLNDKSETFLIGATIGLFGTKNKINATFDKTLLGLPYDTEVDIETNIIDLHIGLAGLVYIVPEKVSIDFSLAPALLFAFGDQSRYKRTPAVNGDTRDNTWGKSENKENDMNFPNIDVAAVGRIGVSYHFTEIMWVGALVQYHQPIISFGGEMFEKDAIRVVNDDIHYSDRRHKGWAAMLTWGIDLD